MKTLRLHFNDGKYIDYDNVTDDDIIRLKSYRYGNLHSFSIFDECGDRIENEDSSLSDYIRTLSDNDTVKWLGNLFISYLDSHNLSHSSSKFEALSITSKANHLRNWCNDFVNITIDGNYIVYTSKNNGVYCL